MDILKLLELGATVGLHGRGLCDFIKAEREKEHASRVLEREKLHGKTLTEKGKRLKGRD